MAQQKYKSEPIKEGQKKSNIKHQSFGTQALPPPKPTAITKTNKPMAKQTAVEWLEDVYNTQGHILPAQFEQAKQMEKEQIEKAHYISGCYMCHDDDKYERAEQYYNETYGTRLQNETN